MSANWEGWLAAAPAASIAAGRLCTPNPISRAETAKVDASASRAARTPRPATTRPPSANPDTMPSWKVIWVTAVPRTYFSPVRMSGTSADLADLNGESSSATRNRRAIMTQRTTMACPTRLTSTIRHTSAMRARSQTIITWRRGFRSASPDRPSPPTIHGRNVAAKVSALHNGECVRSYTRTIMATPGQLVTGYGQQLRQPQGPELSCREHIAERCPGQFARPVIRHFTGGRTLYHDIRVIAARAPSQAGGNCRGPGRRPAIP